MRTRVAVARRPRAPAPSPVSCTIWPTSATSRATSPPPAAPHAPPCRARTWRAPSSSRSSWSATSPRGRRRRRRRDERRSEETKRRDQAPLRRSLSSARSQKLRSRDAARIPPSECRSICTVTPVVRSSTSTRGHVREKVSESESDWMRAAGSARCRGLRASPIVLQGLLLRIGGAVNNALTPRANAETPIIKTLLRRMLIVQGVPSKCSTLLSPPTIFM